VVDPGTARLAMVEVDAQGASKVAYTQVWTK
jgi:hypothetical protein